MTPDIEDILKAMPLTEPTPALDERVMATLANEGRDVRDAHDTDDTRVAPDAPPLKLVGGGAAAFPRYPRLISWLGGVAAMAAMIALTITWALYDPGQPVTPDGSGASQPSNTRGASSASLADNFTFDPVRIEHHWSSVQPRGVVMVDDQTPAAGFVQQSVQHIELVDDKNNVRMEFTVPRSDVLLVPVGYE